MFTLIPSLALVLLSNLGLAAPLDADINGVDISRRASNASSLQVDLGYEVYDGFYDASFGFNTWLGIRYAASTSGNNRWRAPQGKASTLASLDSISANATYSKCTTVALSLSPGVEWCSDND